MLMITDSHHKKPKKKTWNHLINNCRLWLKGQPSQTPCNARRCLEKNTQTFEHTIQTIVLFTSLSTIQICWRHVLNHDL